MLLANLLNENYDISIFEAQNRILKKVLASGNGMCNLSNDAFSDVCCLKDKFNTNLDNVFKRFDLDKLKEVFKNLGLILRKDSEGRYYPYSKKATNVYDILSRNLGNNVHIYTDFLVNDIKCDNCYIINGEYEFDYVIMACGSKASVNFKYNADKLVNNLGIKINDLKPSLVGLKVYENIKSISGLRIKAKVSFYKDNKLIDVNKGEVQFKDDGISGIVIMEESRFFDNNKNCKVELDFMEEYDEKELYQLIKDLAKNNNDYKDILLGILPKMLTYDIVARSKNLDDIVDNIKHYCLKVKDTYGFDNCQVVRGGVDLNEIDLNTFESKKYKNLYFMGELLDVDGTCGGFNLHFAWASAYIVSEALNRLGE